MPERITKVVVELVLPIASLITFSFAAYTVWRHRWFRARPLLSVYVWLQAAVGSGLFLLCRLAQACSGTAQYTLCRFYFVGCQAFIILTCISTLAVAYEFLFCADEADQTIRRKAVRGFFIATNLAIAGAAALEFEKIAALSLEGISSALYLTTALTLIFSSIYILSIKNSNSLFMNRSLAMVF